MPLFQCLYFQYFREEPKKANIKVLNFDLLDTTTRKDNLTGAFISDLVLQIIAYVSEIERVNIKERQREGIAIARAKGKYKGRKSIMSELMFLQHYEKIKHELCSVNQLCKDLGITKTTYYRYYRKYVLHEGYK
ncbi:MAG: recombinase family protein [Ruminobacter sp.]|nr:recombinase family protein [Ruminobacter sp.]